ncbi:protein kinase, partial [bacterium]|nr:protein kinase [bacterium]
EVKITDFGLASLKDQPTVTQEGMVVGTPSYMAPEQAGGGEITPATDVFAVGLILFEMLTGRRVHEGATMAETFQNVVKYQPPKLDACGDLVPEAVRPVLAAMLERSPAKRPRSAAVARQGLQDSNPESRLPRALIQDFLSGEPQRRATTPSVARIRAWSKPFRLFTIITLLVAGAGLIFHLATLTRPTTEEGTSEQQPMDTMAAVSPFDSANVPPGRSDTIPVVQREPVPEEFLDTEGRRLTSRVEPQIPVEKPIEPVLEPQTGFLEVVSRPWAQVYIGDSLVGTTPLKRTIEVRAGSYNVVFMNPEIGLPIILAAAVRGGDTTRLQVNLYDYVARIRIASVKPWADVYVNDQFVLRTPSSKIIFQPLGTHTITLRNPEFPDYTEALTFSAGDSVREIRVDLAKPR